MIFEHDFETFLEYFEFHPSTKFPPQEDENQTYDLHESKFGFALNRSKKDPIICLPKITSEKMSKNNIVDISLAGGEKKSPIEAVKSAT